MIILADKVKDLLEKLKSENNENSIEIVYNFIKNFTIHHFQYSFNFLHYCSFLLKSAAIP